MEVSVDHKEITQPLVRQETDRTLLESLGGGDAASFWPLWRRHEHRIIDVCRRRMKGVQADVEDAVSRSMVAAFERMPAYASSILNVEAWLTRLSCNICIDIQRERVRISRNAVSASDGTDIAETVASADSPEERCSATEIGTLIAIAIRELPAMLRTAAQLRFVDEVSYPEMAERLAITAENARKRVQQARRMLKERLVRQLRPPSLRERL
jgi:RNA polymerase sigma factor (sigma-70 family)